MVAGAGSGRRLGGVPKPFLELAGRTVLEWSLAPFLEEPRTTAVVVALPREVVRAPPGWLLRLDPRVTLVPGGAERGDSVRRALDALPRNIDVVAVHDAARPLVDPRTVTACIDRAVRGGGGVAGVPVADSMKLVDGEGRIAGELERGGLWRARTPQCFPAETLRRAYRSRAALRATDDASLVRRLGEPLVMIREDSPNPKITYPGDAELVEALLERRLQRQEP